MFSYPASTPTPKPSEPEPRTQTFSLNNNSLDRHHAHYSTSCLFAAISRQYPGLRSKYLQIVNRIASLKKINNKAWIEMKASQYSSEPLDSFSYKISCFLNLVIACPSEDGWARRTCQLGLVRSILMSTKGEGQSASQDSHTSLMPGCLNYTFNVHSPSTLLTNIVFRHRGLKRTRECQ